MSLDSSVATQKQANQMLPATGYKENPLQLPASGLREVSMLAKALGTDVAVAVMQALLPTTTGFSSLQAAARE